MRFIKTLKTKIETLREGNRIQYLAEEKALKISESIIKLDENKKAFALKAKREITHKLEEHPLIMVDKKFKVALKSLEVNKKQNQIKYENSSWWGKMNFPTHVELDIEKNIKKISKKQSKFLLEYKKDIKKINNKYKKAGLIIEQRLTEYHKYTQVIIKEQYQDIDTEKVLSYGMWGSIFGLSVSAMNDVYQSQQVYEVLRNVNSNFLHMTDTEIWWETLFMDSDSLVGLSSLTKGALFEDMIANNTGGELFEHFNHPVTDIVIDGTEIQLKATDSVLYVNSALENSTVISTSEVADKTAAIDSGISNESLNEQVEDALGGTVLDVGDIAFDTLLGGGIGLGTIPILKGLAHINQDINDIDRYIEGAEIAIVGTAKGVVDTSEMIHNAATSPTGKAIGKAGLAGMVSLGKGLMWGMEKTLGKL